MRILLFLLSFFPLVALANIPQVYFVPYKKITLLDEKIDAYCTVRANVSKVAYKYAKKGIKLESQLIAWDNFALSEKSKNLPTSEILKIRKIIKFVYVVLREKPKVTSDQVAVFIYETCINEYNEIRI